MIDWVVEDAGVGGCSYKDWGYYGLLRICVGRREMHRAGFLVGAGRLPASVETTG